MFSDSFALEHRRVTLICPPDAVTRGLAWRLVTRGSRVSVELLMFFIVFFKIFLGYAMACGILVSQLRIPPVSLVVEV